MDGYRRIMASLALLSLLVLTPGSVAAHEAPPASEADRAELVLFPNAPAYCLSNDEWTARFAQWHLALPTAVNPGTDPTGERRGYGQSEPVFFLVISSEGIAERTCTTPAGIAMLLPLLDASYTTVEPPPFFGRDEAES